MAFVKNDEGLVPGLVADLERDLGKALRKKGITKGPAPILQLVPLQLRTTPMQGIRTQFERGGLALGGFWSCGPPLN